MDHGIKTENPECGVLIQDGSQSQAQVWPHPALGAREEMKHTREKNVLCQGRAQQKAHWI